MNYLQLCQRLAREAGIQGSGPAAVTGTSGIESDVVEWVMRAWIDIQLMRPNWNFMWSTFSFPTVAGTRDYAAADVSITDLHLWDEHSFLIYKTATGESDQNELGFWRYDQWRAKFRNRMGDRSNDRPQGFTILPNKSVRFEPRPDAIYTIEGDYKKSAQTMTANADTPTGLPDDFHMIIVWQALIKYGYKKAAPERLELAETERDSLLFRLEDEELPEMVEDYRALA